MYTSEHVALGLDLDQVKNTVWALYSRAQILWNSCMRMRQLMDASNNKPSHSSNMDEFGYYRLASPRVQSMDLLSDSEVSTFALQAWFQAQEIEDALDAHNCSLERAFMFQGRELLHRYFFRFLLEHFSSMSVQHSTIGYSRFQSLCTIP